MSCIKHADNNSSIISLLELLSACCHAFINIITRNVNNTLLPNVRCDFLAGSVQDCAYITHAIIKEWMGQKETLHNTGYGNARECGVRQEMALVNLHFLFTYRDLAACASA